VIVRKDRAFGPMLLTRSHKALSFWGVEKQARRIVCTETGGWASGLSVSSAASAHYPRSTARAGSL